MIILDASFLIAHVRSSDPHHESATNLLFDAELTPLAASVVTVAEVLAGYAKRGRLELGTAALRDLEVHRIPMDAYMAESLAQLRADTNLKLPDCCVILAAEQAKADTIATFDEQLGKAARKRGLRTLT